MKNSTLLRSRVEFQIKFFCFFTVCLTGGTSYQLQALQKVLYGFRKQRSEILFPSLRHR